MFLYSNEPMGFPNYYGICADSSEEVLCFVFPDSRLIGHLGSLVDISYSRPPQPFSELVHHYSLSSISNVSYI
jgi:hypothetical protein